MKIEVKSLKRR